jgi:hypothetical protein
MSAAEMQEARDRLDYAVHRALEAGMPPTEIKSEVDYILECAEDDS